MSTREEYAARFVAALISDSAAFNRSKDTGRAFRGRIVDTAFKLADEIIAQGRGKRGRCKQLWPRERGAPPSLRCELEAGHVGGCNASVYPREEEPLRCACTYRGDQCTLDNGHDNPCAFL